MEADWERREPYLPLKLEEARRMLARFGISALSLSLLPEGRANTNYLLETSEGPRVLRLHQRQGEAPDLSFLAPEGVPRPELRVASPKFSVFTWCPGISLESALVKGRHLPYAKIARQAAEVRLAMNEARCESAGLFDEEAPENALDLSGQHDNPLRVKTKWPSAVEGYLLWLRGLLPSAPLANEERERIRQVFEDAEPRLQAIAEPPVLVHGDFKASNLIVDEDGLQGVIDWEFAHAGTWLSDVGQLLRHPESLPEGFADAFLDRLGAPEDAALLGRVLDLANLVAFLGDKEGRPKMRAGLLGRINEVCGLYEKRFMPHNA